MKRHVDKLSDFRAALTNLYIESVDMSNKHFQYNIFLSCVLDRALSVNRGYMALTESNNYFCAVAMLRMQIENCTRLYGMTHVDDAPKYIQSWMGGEKISKFQDVETHKSLSDSYIASKLENQYKNIAAMYKEACGFVHFSERQLYDTAKVKSGTRTVNLKVSEEDSLKDEEKNNIDKCMLNVDNILIDIVINISKEYVESDATQNISNNPKKYRTMNIKEFTESAIAIYLEKGGIVHPDISLDIFQLIENNESLLNDYVSLKKHYKEVNPTIGKTIRQYFDLRNDKPILVAGQCKLIKNYMRFHKKI